MYRPTSPGEEVIINGDTIAEFTGNTGSYTYEIRFPDGSTRWVYSDDLESPDAGKPTFTDDGGVLCIHHKSSRTIHIVSIEEGENPMTGEPHRNSLCQQQTGQGGTYSDCETISVDPSKFTNEYLQRGESTIGKFCSNCLAQVDRSSLASTSTSGGDLNDS